MSKTDFKKWRKISDTDKIQRKNIPTLLLANTLDYYEQLQLYSTTTDLQKYMIEKPRWIFVGSKVNTENSDILEVFRFLDYLLKTNKKIIVNEIEKLVVDGESGIMGPDNRDVFTRNYPERNFPYLREQIKNNLTSPEKIYQGILEHVFQIAKATESQRLELHDIKNFEGEIGLKTSRSNQFFGVINIGDKSGFLKLVREETSQIPIREDVLQKSLFDIIDRKNSTINLLLGAKKFKKH